MEISKTKTIRIISFLLALPMLSLLSCNSDIFVSPVDDVAESVSLSGDLGTASFRIQRKGLESVDFDVHSIESTTYDAYTDYFDSDGNRLSPPFNVDDVARILYYSHTFAVEFKVNGDKVDITALDNANPNPIDVVAYLNYGYTSRSVTIHISQGRPLEIDFLGHDMLRPNIGTITVAGPRQRFNNNTDLPIKMTIYPYREAKSSITLTPDEYWAQGICGTIPIPAYVDGEWNAFYSDDVQVTIGSATTYCSAVVDEDEAAYIEVPAGSSVVTVLTVNYATLDSKYISDIKLPNSGLTWHCNGDWELRQPISYQITTTTE